MIAITHFRDADPVSDEGSLFSALAQDALEALACCRGFRRGSLGRSTDDSDAWILLTEWDNVGSYRRALGTYDVKLRATPLMALALDVPSGFESLVDVAPGGETIAHSSDRAEDA